MKWHRLENICFSFASKELLKFRRRCNKCISAFILLTWQLFTQWQQPVQPPLDPSTYSLVFMLHYKGFTTTVSTLSPSENKQKKEFRACWGWLTGLRKCIEVTGWVYSQVSGENNCKSLFSFWLQELLDAQNNLPWCWRQLELSRFAFKNQLGFSLFCIYRLDKSCELLQLVCTHLGKTPADSIQQTSLHLCPWRN